MNQQLITNINSGQLESVFESLNAKKVFLVTGKNSFETSGAKRLVNKISEGMELIHFNDFEQNPKYEDTIKGIKLALESDCDIFLGIGGGSVMDMTKLINIFSTNEKTNSLEIIKDSIKIDNRGKPTILIPTTAGSGSEATQFAVVYYNNKKYSVSHPFLLADIVGLNHNLTSSQSSYLTACAGLDALSQAIESFWSVGSTPESKEFARAAIVLLLNNLQLAVHKPNPENRKAIQMAAYLAGKAINISKTTAAHAFSYAFTTFYSIPHGHAVFLTLPYFLVLNSPDSTSKINDPRGATYLNETMNELFALLGVTTKEKACSFLLDFSDRIGVELNMNKLGIDSESKLDFILGQVNLERLGNNPVMVSIEQVKKELLINP